MPTKKVRTSNKFQYITGSDEPTEVVAELTQYSWWIFGVPKIGKTALAAQFPKAHFCRTEKGHKSQSIKGEDLVGLPWEAYEEYADFIEGTSKYETTVIDVLEKAYDASYLYMLEKLGIEVDEAPEWQQWSEIRKPFMAWMKRLLTLQDKGCIFISHASVKEFEDTIGETSTQVHPNFTGKLLNAIEGEVDILAYFGYFKGHRLLQIDGDESVRAGNRITTGFLDEEGNCLKYIPMGRSPTEAYENIQRAFENEQKFHHLHHVFPPKEKTIKEKVARK